MNEIIVGIIILLIGAWFLYGLKRLWDHANTKDCASCSMGGEFDYKKIKIAPVKRKPVKEAFVNGHRIVMDAEAARKRRERIRKLKGA